MLLVFLLIFTTQAQRVEFWGNHFVSVESEGKVIITDSAGIREGKTLLISDSIVYLRDSGVLWAYKNPILIIDNDTLIGDSLLYRTDTGKGVAFGGKTHVQKGWLYGKTLYKVSKDVLQVTHGIFTTCDLEPPHYHFYSSKMVIRKNDMAVVTPLILKIHNLPVVAAPFWFFPVSSGRKSGFMTPRFGFNSLDGRFIRNLSYYWAINNYMDLTTTLDLIEKRGVRLGIDFIYTLYKHFNGSMALTLAQEFSPEKRRWSLFGSHLHTLGRGFKIRAQSNLASDVDYLQDYSEDKTEWLKTEWNSFISVSKTWSFASMNLTVDDRRDLVRNTRRTTLPSIHWGLYTLNLGPARLTHNLDFTHKRAYEESLSVYTVANSNLNLSLQSKLFGVIQLAPNITEITTFFDRDTAGKHLTRRDIVRTQLSISTVIYGMSLFGLGPVERFRQTLRPSFSLSFTPNINQENIVSIGGYGPIPPSRTYTFTLSNTYEGKLKSGKKITILTSQLSTSRDLLHPEAKAPVSVSSQLFPQERINWRFSGTYSTEKRKFTQISIVTNLSFSLGKRTTRDSTSQVHRFGPWNFRITHSMTRQEEGKGTQRLSISLNGKMTKNWDLSYSFDLDPESGEILSQSLNLNRDLHCWALSFRWWTQPGGVWSYDFKIWIKALPDISFKRSLFEVFLPK